ncbi:enoyl-CoA hydratase [Marinobacter litoralis]|uniref:enoyl-CoA hydratase n=1 Tax=Marinobacter litoralis TaxID=187981 RepID=UPI0018EC3431|nr:enoyl-CoA hydratase [Marinobacter litoralis]MBJ6136081.1 enoyl-CoA hydratase/isomerase family protein [Marinobacter litoralis]
MTDSIPIFKYALITHDTRGVYTLQIQNAKSVNILGSAEVCELLGVFRWLGTRQDARVVVVRGTGEKAFVAGANIYEMAGLESEAARSFITGLRRLCDAIMDIPVPTVARIPGFCLGAGMEIAAACDIRLGSKDAVFGMPEVRVGIPSVIHAALLPKIIGAGATNWLLLTGENVSATQAEKWGFLEFVCESGAENLDLLIEQTVEPILKNGPGAVRAQKALLRYWSEADLEASLDRSVTAFGDAFKTAEPRTYMSPFTQGMKSGS